MTTTSINGRKVIQLTAGDSLVWLLREGREVKRPFYFDVEFNARDMAKLSNHYDHLSPGDVLSFPHDFGDAWITVEVRTRTLWNMWVDTVKRHFPAYPMDCPTIALTFQARQVCPMCDTDDLHDAEMADLPTDTDSYATVTRRYVVRTCITCDTSWEQEVSW